MILDNNRVICFFLFKHKTAYEMRINDWSSDVCSSDLFDDVFVPHDNLLGGEEGLGFYQLMEQLAWERTSVALNCVVEMEEAVRVTTDYVRQRSAFGKPIAEFQNTQFKLAECKTQAVVARVFIDEMMVRLLAGELDAATAAMAKYWTSEIGRAHV